MLEVQASSPVRTAKKRDSIFSSICTIKSIILRIILFMCSTYLMFVFEYVRFVRSLLCVEKNVNFSKKYNF